MSDSVRPHRRQPTRPRRPWDSPGKNTGVGCHFLLQCMKAKSESEVAQSCPTLRDPMDCSLPGYSIHGLSRQEYWSGLPFLSLGDLPNPGIEPGSPALRVDALPSEPAYLRLPEAPARPLRWCLYFMSACLSRCSGGLRPLVELCVEPAGISGNARR